MGGGQHNFPVPNQNYRFAQYLIISGGPTKLTITGRFCQGSQIRNEFRWKVDHVRIVMPDS